MRTEYKDMIEILSAFEKDGSYFVQIAKCFDVSRFIYQFGVSKAGYNTVKRIFQFRPFNTLAQTKYRYFWNRGCGSNDDFYLAIYFVQGGDLKSYPIKADKQLGANLMWFMEIKNPNEIEHLKIET